jgi:hypothetical protein
MRKRAIATSYQRQIISETQMHHPMQRPSNPDESLPKRAARPLPPSLLSVVSESINPLA